MVDSCATCFYSRIVTNRGLTYRACSKTAPAAITSDTDPAKTIAQWAEVFDDQWCGDGADTVTGISFSALVNDLPTGPGGPQGPPADLDDQCSTCFFSRMTTKDGFTYRSCNKTAPATVSSDFDPNFTRAQWAEVADTLWCGDGADADTGRSFSSPITQVPARISGPQGPEGLTGRNILSANGGFEVWQRASNNAPVFADTPTYVPDRWYVDIGANTLFYINAEPGLTDPSAQSIRLQRVQPGTGTVIFGFVLTTDECSRLRGQKLALQFVTATGAGWSAPSGLLTFNAYFGTGLQRMRGAGFTNETNPLSGTINLAQGAAAAQTKITSLMTTVATNVSQGELQFSWDTSGALGADHIGTNDWLGFDDVQMEPGNECSTFERPSFAQMLFECQRHFAKTFPYTMAPQQGAGVPGALCCLHPTDGVLWNFPVPMLGDPTIVTYNPYPGSLNENWRDVTAGADKTAVVDPDSSKSADRVFIQATGVTSTNHIYIHATADAGLY